MGFQLMAIFLIQETFDYEVSHTQRKENGSATQSYTEHSDPLLPVGEREGIVQHKKWAVTEATLFT